MASSTPGSPVPETGGGHRGGRQRVDGRVLLVPGLAVAAEGPQDLAVPAALRRPRLPRLAGLVEGGDRVDAAVDDARLDADDEGDGPTVVGGRRRDVGGRVGRVVVGEAG